MTEPLGKMRNDAIAIFKAGLEAVRPENAVKKYCSLKNEILSVNSRDFDLREFSRIVVIGAGKASGSMAKGIEDLFGSKISQGMVIAKYNHLESLSIIEITEAGHPVPDQNGLQAACSLLQLAEDADETTLIIFLISGGASAMTPLPVEGVTLEDKQQATRILLGCGATIQEINTIRKHLSQIKGGGLARAAYPATCITLILSDVVGNDLHAIGSGPCVPDPTTYADCLEIIKKYEISSEIPKSILEHIAAGIDGIVAETPKEEDKIFGKTENVIIGDNFIALQSAKEKAAELGYNTLLLSSMIEGETKDAAALHMAIAKEIELHDHPVPKPACLLSGGETTVTIRGEGKGGRNQEFVLAAAQDTAGMTKTVVLSGGTDGTDGPTDAAGAISDNTTLCRALRAGMDPKEYLADNDSYHFFEALGDLYKTGPTNTNVMDLRIILVAGS